MVAKARRISGEAQAEHYSNSLWSSALARDVFVTAFCQIQIAAGKFPSSRCKSRLINEFLGLRTWQNVERVDTISRADTMAKPALLPTGRTSYRQQRHDAERDDA
jgi:hypothetical protein